MAKRVFLLILLFVVVAGMVCAQDKKDALAFYRQGKYQEAVDVCLEELKEMPNRMDSYAVLCWSLLKLKKYQETHDYAQKALNISRYDPRMIEIAGEALFYLGRWQEALKYFEEYTAINPTGGRVEDVYYFMGELFIQLGKYNNADIALSTALYHSPNVASWWARLGYTREKAGDYSWSLDAYNKALKLNPNQLDASRGKSRVEKLSDGG